MACTPKLTGCVVLHLTSESVEITGIIIIGVIKHFPLGVDVVIN